MGGASSGGSTTSKSSTSSSNTGAIAGGTVGGVAFLVLLSLLLFCCIRRTARSRRGSETDPAIKSYGIESSTEKTRKRPMDILRTNARQSTDDPELGSDESPAGGRPTSTNEQNYEPSPFRYPSPPPPGAPNGASTPGANANIGATLASAGMFAAASEKATQGSHATPQRPIGQALTNSARQSLESLNNSVNTGGTNQTNPTFQTSSGAAPRTSMTGDNTSRSEQPTLGHSPARQSSIRKAPLQPPPPVQASPTTQLAPAVGVGENGRPLPESPRQRETTFVQHQDAGEVV